MYVLNFNRKREIFYQTNTTTTEYQWKWNALHYAAQYGAPDDIIKALIDAGADPKANDYTGRTPADLACKKYTATASLIEQYGLAPIKSANLTV
jgi:hypothetical protein